MTEPLPFDVSPEAAEYLRRVAVIPEMEAGISLCYNLTARNDAGEITDCYDAPHFTIGWHAPGVWRCAVYRIVGREFFITPQTVEALCGKTLQVLRRYEGERQRGRIQHVLVARSCPVAAAECITPL